MRSILSIVPPKRPRVIADYAVFPQTMHCFWTADSKSEKKYHLLKDQNWFPASPTGTLRTRKIKDLGVLGHLFPSLLLLFLAKHSSAHLQHRFKSFPASLCILLESFHTSLFNFRLDFLEPATQCGDLSILAQLGSLVTGGRRASIRFVDYRFSNTQDITPCQVCGAHRDAFGGGRYIGCFVYVRDCRTSK